MSSLTSAQRKGIQKEIRNKRARDKRKLEKKLRTALKAKDAQCARTIQEVTDTYEIAINEQIAVIDQTLEVNMKLNGVKERLRNRLNFCKNKIETLCDKLEETMSKSGFVDEEWICDDDEKIKLNQYSEVYVDIEPSETDKDVIYGVQQNANKKYKRYSVCTYLLHNEI